MTGTKCIHKYIFTSYLTTVSSMWMSMVNNKARYLRRNQFGTRTEEGFGLTVVEANANIIQKTIEKAIALPKSTVLVICSMQGYSRIWEKHLHRLGSLISVFIWDSFFSWEVEATLRNLTDDNRETKGTESRTRRFLWSMLWTRISIIFFPSFDYSALVRQYCLTKCFQGLCTITSVLKTWKCAR